MTSYVGVDWSRNGWFGVVLKDGGKSESDLYPSILSVWKNHKDAERILIDIPIGLSTTGKRACDEEASEELKPVRQNSVFSTPIRDAIYSKTLNDAKKLNEKFGFSISNQSWSICLRIREVDEFFAEYPNATGTIRESHPEICFSALNDGEPLEYTKTTSEGLEKRKRVLFGEDEQLEAVYDDAVESFIEPPQWARRLSKNARDDVLDALVLAHIARKSDEELATLPANPAKDFHHEEPLPMEIVY